MFNPQAILAAALVFLAAALGGFWAGHDWADTKHEAQRVRDIEAYNSAIHAQIVHANKLADKLAKAESTIHTKTVEVIKYVPQVTTGKPCLDAAAVSLLQPGANPGIRPPAGKPPTEDATPVASDTDIAYWIADANGLYETCALRLNALIDWAGALDETSRN